MHCRRALEALRAGVPNRDVVRLLAPLQPRIESAFDNLLAGTQEAWEAGKAAPPPGLIIEGGFGSGKSHLLEYLRHVALENNFICSRVVLNKETPLNDLGKVYRACVASAEAPGKLGPALTEIADSFHPDRAPHYRELFDWARRERDLDPRLAATLFLFERQSSADEDLREKIIAEWTGFPMKVSEMKAALKALGEQDSYRVGRPLKDQAHRRFEFLARFFRAVGYAGWVLLMDETEMVSKYSLRQRGKSYAHLAQLLGQVKGRAIPGVAAVFMITDDYAGEVLRRRADIVKVPAKMRMAGDPLADEAERGMALIESKTLPLNPPTRAQVDQTYERVRELYGAAYYADRNDKESAEAVSPLPPPIENAREYATSTRMRQYVRTWINIWDLRRLYDYAADMVTENLAVSYDEDADLQAETQTEEDGDDAGNGKTPAAAADAVEPRIIL